MKPAPITLALLLPALWLCAPALAQDPPADDRPVLELSLDETVERALKNNTDILVQKYEPEISGADVLGAEGAYDPLLEAELVRTSSTSPARDAFSGGAKIEKKIWDYNARASKLFGSGGSLRLDFANNRSLSNRVFESFNPSFGSTLTLSGTQPLTRNFRIDQSRQRLKVAKLNREISEAQFKQTVLNVIALAKKQYYDINFAQDNLLAQRKSLALAKKLLDENQIKVRVGTLAPLDVVAAEAEVAGREETVIQAEALLQQVEDSLKRTILAQNDPAAWNLRIVTRDRASAQPPTIDLQAATQAALTQRTDVLAAKKAVESGEVGLRFAKNQLLPALDLVASYGATGVGGTQLLDANGQPLAQPIPGGYGDAVGDVFGRDFPTWTLGVNFSYPLFNKSARGAEARSQLTKEQAEASLRRLELQVAADVRTAARNVETGYKRVEATRAARVLSERRLEAEQKRFDAGMSTNFLVTQAQRDLAVAEVNEIKAVADYTKSGIDFERVQQAGGGVSFASSSGDTGN